MRSTSWSEEQRSKLRSRACNVAGCAAYSAASVAWVAQAQTTVEYIHADALGSPVAVTNQAGQVIERLDYEPYGAIIGQPNYGGIGFTGHVQDAATGLTYMQQRYYDPGVGMMLSVDPVTALSSRVGYFHRYRYAANNPYKFTDPDGRCYTSTGECMTSEEFDQAWSGEGIRVLRTGVAPVDSVLSFKDAVRDRDKTGVALAVVGILPGGRFASFGKFLKGSEFGKSIAGSLIKTSRQYQGQSIYKVTEKIENSILKKGDQLYMDAKHKDHIEVFDSTGKAKAVLNMDGTTNVKKTEAAIEAGRRLKD
ncbi:MULTISPECIES: RHS repeat-associated core domain-containing protein [unclassified Pseudoxanthomonas]|uniref:RHS repeat domain-containing protein n=1 Tax=unclassified Pseudoxanthomonas TaxID=2645906 RepID=UPI003076904F